MVLGAGLIALAETDSGEQMAWQAAAMRESARYGVDPNYTRSRALGEGSFGPRARRTWLDWTIVIGATAVLAGFGTVAAAPHVALNVRWVIVLAAVMLAIALWCGSVLWRHTRFV